MAAIDNLVHETSTSTGASDLTLVNVNGKQSFNTAFGTGGTNVFYYFISNRAAAEWEVGTGHLSASSTLVRDTPIDGSAALPISFTAGTKDVTNAEPAATVVSANQGHLWGLTLSNNGTDIVNDIDVSVGSAASALAPYPLMANTTAALTKRLDAAWAVGDGAGGRMSAAAIANTTYHVFLIMRPDTGVVDMGFDVSATAPTLPTSYTHYRRIGSIIRDVGTIFPFYQNGDLFQLDGYTAEGPYTADYDALVVITGIPLGISVQPILMADFINTTDGTDAYVADARSGGSSMFRYLGGDVFSGGKDYCNVTGSVFSDTSGQVYVHFGETTAGTMNLYCGGWIDDRGRSY